jgi:3-mercaptopyruvate sulfurtransferase SseA
MLVLKLMGYDRVKNYDASWNEWGNRDDTAIVR